MITGGTGCFYGATGVIWAEANGNLYEHNMLFDHDTPTPSCTAGIFDGPWYEYSEGGESIDYDGDGRTSTGDMWLFDYHEIYPNDELPGGTVSGKCILMDEIDAEEYTYCQMVFVFDEGQLVVEGFFSEMTIVGGSGCFAGITGIVEGYPYEFDDDIYEYWFTLD